MADQMRMVQIFGSTLGQKGFDVILLSLVLVLMALLFIHWRQWRLLKRLDLQARTDDLTHIANRRHFFELLENNIALAQRHGLPFTLLCFDLDFFKKVNDENGHLAGDKVLCKVAKAILKESRKEDIVGRLGGDEFGVQLTMADQESAPDCAERLRRSIEAIDCSDIGEGVEIKASIGIAVFHSGDTPQMLYKKADSAMYKAKKNGKNCAILDGE